MPGYITHNIFGRTEYKNIKGGIVKESIRKHRNAYYVGLQGPDIFFYFPGYRIISKRNLGSVMHTSNTGQYMYKLMEYIMKLYDKCNKNDADIVSNVETCLAYYSGFLGHYSLDRTCHPYIYWKTDIMNKTKDYHAKHVSLETDIDYIFCKEFYKKRVSDFPYGEIAKLNREDMKAIAIMLSEILQYTFSGVRLDYKLAYAVLLNFGYVVNEIKDDKGKKEKIVANMENMIMGHNHFATLFIRDNYKIRNNDCLNLSKQKWFNPWDNNIQDNSNFYELTKKAGKRFQKLVSLEEQLLQQKDNQKNKDMFIKELGNKSFLTGL